MRILLAEDDMDLGEAVCDYLRHEGMTIDWVQDGQSALHALTAEHFDAVVLDIGLPELSGLGVLKNIRHKNNSVPVLVLTARNTVDDQIEGLETGADDYLNKPLNMEVLVARIRALQRRALSRATNEIVNGKVALDPHKNTLTYNGETLVIPRREYALLKKLIENCGTVITRNVLSQSLYGWDDDIDSNTLEVHIHSLRKRFGDDFPIKTVRGVGYLLEKVE